MDKPVHFRRCHVCGSMNHKEDDRVEYCSHCGKPLPQFYYFDDRYTAIYGEGTLRPPMMQGEYQPIQGLTVYWESF